MTHPPARSLCETNTEEGVCINPVTRGILIRVAGTQILSYKSCLSFYYINPIRGHSVLVDLCCDMVSLSFLLTSAFVQSSFKGPTCSPTNVSDS